MPGRFRHGVVDAEAVTAPVDEVAVRPHPRRIVEAARAAQRRRRIGARPSRAHQALQLGDRHRAVIARLDLGVGVEFEAHGCRLAAAAPGVLDGGEPRRRGDLVEQVAGQRVGRFRQHRQRRPRHRRRRGAAGKLVGADHLALAVAAMRPVDRELPRPERTEAFDHDASAPRDRPDRCRDTSAARRAAGTAHRRARSRLP